MSSEYGYINARVRGMKAKLLGAPFYQAALDGTDFRAFTSALAQTPYMRDLEEAQAKQEGLTAVDRAVARNVYRTARSMLSFADGTPPAHFGMVLLRYDTDIEAACVRGKYTGRVTQDQPSSII